MFIDTHAHIYSEEFSGEYPEMIERAGKAGVKKILMPAIDASTHGAMLQLEENHPTTCLSMMGLHPCSVNENLEEELKTVENHLKQRKFVAIGETGLDFHWDLTYKEQQYHAFEQQAEWAIEYNIPIVIHSRKSTQACIDVIKKYTPKGLRGVFHCFSGSLELAKSIIKEGFYLGIGGVLTFKNAGLAEVVTQLPMEYLILETDAPYLSPVPYRGKRNEPAYIPLVAEKLAALKSTTIEDVETLTTKNAMELFNLTDDNA